ncbi:MAG TPA: NADH:flavin oxidoreductase [Planctomycetes bacterium]|nr:NADH:flavin oxidoreductase [Planctomycetota bacterium]
MKDFRLPASFADAVDFDARLKDIDPALGCDADLLDKTGPMGQSIQIGNKTLRNRFAIHPMEGWDGTHEGLPSEATLRRWRRFGLSGASLIWGGEAFAVVPEGRANPNQLHQGSSASAGDGLKGLLKELCIGREEAGVEQQDFFAGLQLTHSGRWSSPTKAGASPRIAYRHPTLDERAGVQSDEAILTDEEIAALPGKYAAAALLAAEAGFGFVDVKCCHGYLLHEFLSARSRPGPWGGDFEGRTRLFREIVAAVREAAPAIEIGVRLSVTDLFPFSSGEEGRGEPDGLEKNLPYEAAFGLNPDNPLQPDFAEPFRFISLLEKMGISLINLTVGSPYYCPHAQRPAAFPPSDGYQPPVDPLESVAAHLLAARACKEEFPHMIFVGSGYSYLQDWLPHVAQNEIREGHVDFVGLGRMVLSYPELPTDILAGRPLRKKQVCRTFSDCTTGPRNGMPSGCYPLDPHYRGLPEAKRIRALRPRKN